MPFAAHHTGQTRDDRFHNIVPGWSLAQDFLERYRSLNTPGVLGHSAWSVLPRAYRCRPQGRTQAEYPLLARTEEQRAVLEQRPLEPGLRASDELSSRNRDLTGGRLIETRPGIRRQGHVAALRHRGGNAQGTHGLHQTPIDQPVRHPQSRSYRAWKNGGVRELPVVQHGASTRWPAHEFDSGAVTCSRIVAVAGGLVPAKRDGRATPPVNAKHRLTATRTGRECMIHGHILGTGRGRVHQNPPCERLGIERTPPSGADVLIESQRVWQREARGDRQSSYDPVPGSRISTRARLPTSARKASTSCSMYGQVL